MKKLLFLNFCFITLLSCNSTSSSLTTSSFTSSLSSISSSSESNKSSNEISSIEESSKETSYTKKIKIYLNPSVQVNNIYYCKTISEAESMNIVSKKIYEKLINEIITLAENKQVSSAFAIYTTLVVKYIERIADHASNIAEWVIYILSGYYKDKQIF